MGNPNDVWLAPSAAKGKAGRKSTLQLVFDPKNNWFQIRVSQDYETQAKIEFSYSDADAYFAAHPDDGEKAMEAINDHMAKNPEHKKGMKAALALLKNL